MQATRSMLACAAALLATAAAVHTPVRLAVCGRRVSRAAAPAMVFDQLKKMADDGAKGVRWPLAACDRMPCSEILGQGGDASQ